MTKYDTAFAAIAALSDDEKLQIMGNMLEGDLPFDCQDVNDILGPISNQFSLLYKTAGQAIADDSIDHSDTSESDVAFDYYTTR
jgi:hypothetical protein